jgi:hypothetical protein
MHKWDRAARSPDQHGPSFDTKHSVYCSLLFCTYLIHTHTLTNYVDLYKINLRYHIQTSLVARTALHPVCLTER